MNTFQIGEYVEYKTRDVIAKAEVVAILGADAYEVKKCGETADGRRRVSLSKHGWQLRRVITLDGELANVYATWLEDHGEARAGAKLRAEFPTMPREALLFDEDEDHDDMEGEEP